MTSKGKRAAAIGGGVLVLAVGAFFLVGNRESVGGLPIVGDVLAPPECPLTSLEPKKDSVIDRPAVAIKIENNPVAYPLSGLEDAEVVYEEPVEGGLTRFLALYHCTDTATAGPVRSARIVDPAIINPYTLILAAAGGNDTVRGALDEAEVVIIDETGAGSAMRRIERAGITSEHTLYADSAAVRKLGRKQFDEPPPDDLLEFGKLQRPSKKARSVNITFGATAVRYDWNGTQWLRFDGEQPLVSEDGTQIAVDNVLIEEHTVNFSETLGDVIGAPSPEIEDVTGSGRAVLFRDGRAIAGRWMRESVDDPVRFETRSGDALVLQAGTTWIELVPDQKGDIKGSFSYGR